MGQNWRSDQVDPWKIWSKLGQNKSQIELIRLKVKTRIQDQRLKKVDLSQRSKRDDLFRIKIEIG